MVEGLHLYLSDEDIEKIKSGGHVTFDFDYEELSKVMNILIFHEDARCLKMYLCDRKQCGNRCHYPDCRHTTDISHAANAPTFPNGFEKVEHCGKIYFIEREN